MTSRVRADRLLVARGLFESRAKAQAAIAAGRVTADEIPVRRASDVIASDAVLCAEPAYPWVSRGGVKLVAALDHFGFDPRGRVCLDVGASTGGFTEVLVARGARRVYAVDVGRDQLHPTLRTRPEVVAFEHTDVRSLDASRLPLACARTPAQLVALIKPQFEAGRRHVKKGIVREPDIHARVCDDIAAFVGSLGWRVIGVVASPIAGGEGNREFLIGAVGG